MQQSGARGDVEGGGSTTSATLTAAPLFTAGFQWTDDLQAELEVSGHVVLPGVLTASATATLLRAAERIDRASLESQQQQQQQLSGEELQRQIWGAPTEEEQQRIFRRQYGTYVAVHEIDPTAGELVSHPDVLELVTRIIGPDVRTSRPLPLSFQTFLVIHQYRSTNKHLLVRTSMVLFCLGAAGLL